MKNFIILLIPIILSSCGVIEVRKKNTTPYSSTPVSKETSVPKPVKSAPVTKDTKNTNTVINNNTATSSNSNINHVSSSELNNVLSTAKSYLGTPYRYGGTSSAGMDCSGLVFTSFTNNGVPMKRMSTEQAKLGTVVSLSKVQPGDLLFFNTSGRGISHVGIVEKVDNGEIFFIHSSTSKGVIISSLNESYWKPKIVQANRLN